MLGKMDVRSRRVRDFEDEHEDRMANITGQNKI